MNYNTSLSNANNELQDQITKYIEKLQSLSVYNREELFEKGKMLSNLQNIEQTMKETLELLHNKVTEQKLIMEKYMRDAEEIFNTLRRDIYHTHNDTPAEQVSTTTKKLKKPLKVPAFVEKVDTNKPKHIQNNVSKTTPTITNVVNNNNNAWIEVGKKSVTKISTPKAVRREVAPDTFINAITVNNKKECHNHLGWWCWCPDENRFCISINGRIYSGCTTIIHQSNIPPVKFFEHRHSDKVDNWLESDYYVLPEKNPGSKDIRQFTNKMKFVPASRNLEKYETYAYRLGSKDTLRDDIISLKPEDYRIFSDLTTNFLLCLTAASVEMDRRIIE
jgi:hypothetical protein